tara:strand:+ start:44916 stop:45191 length:276 start_codon:yes stop_codon:yes gene_type:complete
MNFEKFQQLCEFRAVRFFTDAGSTFDNSKIDKYVSVLADTLASKHEDYFAYFDIAQETIKTVFANPMRYKKLIANKIENSSKSSKTTVDTE